MLPRVVTIVNTSSTNPHNVEDGVKRTLDTLCMECTDKLVVIGVFFFSSRRRHTRWTGDWSSDVCSSDLSRPLVFCWQKAIRVHRWLREIGIHRFQGREGLSTPLALSTCFGAVRENAKHPGLQ